MENATEYAWHRQRKYDTSVIFANPFILLKFVRIFTINKTQIEEVCFVCPYIWRLDGQHINLQIYQKLSSNDLYTYELLFNKEKNP